MEYAQLTALKWQLQEEHMNRQEILMCRLIKAHTGGDMKEAVSLVELNPEIMSEGLKLIYDSLTDEQKYRLPINCYMNHGDNFAVIRKYVRQARKYMPVEKRIPPEMLKRPEIEVYRAGDEAIDAAKSRISWTTDLEVAKWFRACAAYRQQAPRHIYRGLIRPEMMIHFTDEREEREVMQYRSVYDIAKIK